MDLISVPITLTEQKVRNISFQVLADVYKDNTFAADITSYIISIDNIVNDLEFKQKGTVLGKPSVNTASITLDNTNGLFSPNNINNIEKNYPGGQFRYNTPVKILAGFIDENNQPKQRILFQGIITAFKNKITRDSKQIVLTLKDHATYLQHMKVPNHNYKNGQYYEAVIFDKTIDEAIDYLLDYSLGLDFPRTLHKMTERLPIIEFAIGNSIWQTLQLLAQSVEGRIFFANGEFKFYSPLSLDWNEPITSQYIFNADNIQDFQEEVDFDNIINKWKISSNPKTLQVRQVLCGTPSSNTISMVDEYWTGDGKSALGVDNKTITLKSQLDNLSWVNSLNVPLVRPTQTYSDLIVVNPSPTQDLIDAMNSSSLIKVWDKINNIQLTINNVDPKTGIIELLNPINPDNYNLQITYQYYQDQIVYGKYREFILDLEKIGVNIEYPVIEATNGQDVVTYSTMNSTNTLYLSDWTIFEGNKRVKFKLTNNYPINGTYDTVRLTKIEIWGNALECTAPLSFEAIDGDTINLFENSYEINNNYITNVNWGKQICDYYLYRYKNNLTFLDVNTKGIPQIDLLDRVTINEAVSGNNFDYIVIGIKHSIKKDGWKTNLQLESLIPPWTYDPTRVDALFYKMGQSALNLYSFTNPPQPTNVNIRESTFLQSSGEVVTRIDVSFIPANYPYYAYTLIQMSEDNGLTWKDVGITDVGQYYIYGVIANHSYIIRLKTVSINKLMSNPIDTILTIIGKDTCPGDIKNLTIIQQENILKVTIIPPDDPDIAKYELRVGGLSWETSVGVKQFKDTQTTIDVTQAGTQTFWAKAIDKSKNYSVNAASCIAAVYPISNKFTIYEEIQDGRNWAPSCMFRNKSGWQIDSVEKLGDLEFFAQMFDIDYHLCDNAEIVLDVVDLGETITSTNYIETFLSVFTDFDASDKNYIDVDYRTSWDGVNFGEWQPLVNHQFNGRYVQPKLKPRSIDGRTNVNIRGVTVRIDVTAVTETIDFVNVADTGVTRIYLNHRFFNTPMPQLFSYAETGKQCTHEIVGNLIQKDVDGRWYFDIRLWDGSTQIAGKIGGSAKGY